MRVGIVKASTMNLLGNWSPRRVLRVKEEAESQGVDIDADPERVISIDKDIKWLEDHAQKERKLPFP